MLHVLKQDAIDKVRLKVPVFGPLFTKLYLARISDNMDTMLSSGISITRSIEITELVLDSAKYKEILHNANESVKMGKAFSEAMDGHKEVPQIFVQMMRVGEETGSLAIILKTLSDFYKREVDSAVDTLISLIEPAMIVLLGLGVGTLLVSVMIPIYNIAGAQ
jgi:type IV pilus assembly protein PilC